MKHPAVPRYLQELLQMVLDLKDHYDTMLDCFGINHGHVEAGNGVFLVMDLDRGGTYSYNPYSNELEPAGIGELHASHD